jgi:Zn finger protein HypA/HybF involved in hydrogenase expression
MNDYLKNRDKVKAPKQGKFWCLKCDAYLVHEDQKCPKCGTVNRGVMKGRFKKIKYKGL